MALNGPSFLDRECSKTREKGNDSPLEKKENRFRCDKTCRGRSSSSRPWMRAKKNSTHRIAYPLRVVRPQPIHRPHVPTCTENTRIRQLTLQKRHVGAHDACRRQYVTFRDATSKTNAPGTSTSTLRTRWKPSRGERLHVVANVHCSSSKLESLSTTPTQ